MKKTLFFILLFAFLLRVPLLSGSLWLDEAAQALESSRSFSEQTNIGEDYQPPLFHFIVHFFLQVSREEWWIRLPSVLAALGTIAVVYLLVREKYENKVAVAASLLLATSPFHVFFSQELRPYSLAAFFAVLSWYVLISSRWKERRWLWYTIVTTLGMYSMYLIPFNVFAQLLYVIFEQKKSIKPYLCSLGAVALLFLPWLPSFLNQLRIGTTLTSTLPGWSQAVGTPQFKVLPLTLAKFVVGQLQFHGNPILVGVTAVLLCIVGFGTVQSIRQKETRLWLYWFVLPLLSSWLVSFVVPVLQPKRVMFILPALYVLIALGFRKYSFGKILIGGFIFFQLLCLCIYWNTPSLQREDWRSLVSTIEQQSDRSSVVLFSFPESFAPWQWYARGSVATVSTGKVYIDATSDVSSVSSQLTTVSRVYLFDYLRDLTDPQNVLESTLTSEGFSEQGKIDGKAIGFVRIFARME